MSGAFNSPKHKRKPAINITSLIDVMFLLLIFFMVSSTFKQYMGIDVTLPKAANAASQDAGIHEIVVDRNGGFFLDGEPTAPGELQAGLQALVQSEDNATFMLRADAEASFGRVLRVIDITKTVGGDRLIIPTDLLDEDDW